MENKKSATYLAYQILHIGFVFVPVLAGLDKFMNLLTNWGMYLAPAILKIFACFGQYVHARGRRRRSCRRYRCGR